LKLANQKLKKQEEGLAALQLQLDETQRDNQLKQSKLKEELTNKSEQYHRQVKREKVSKKCKVFDRTMKC